MKLAQNIGEFMGLIKTGKVEIYNEFSLQHELGIFLRDKLPSFKVEFERNVGHFNLQKGRFVKKEIDISVVNRSTGECSAVIELKYPRNGQVPEQMFSFCKDIMFIEQLVQAGFKSGAFVAVADDPLFYSGKAEGIYSMFRAGEPIHGEITKPTGAKDSKVHVRGRYQASWQEIQSKTRWCIIEAAS